MASLPLTTDQRNRLVHLLAERDALVTPLKRQAMLDEAGLDAVRTQLDFATVARIFASELVTVLHEKGSDPDSGEPALLSLLRWLRDEVAGHEADATFVEGLLNTVATDRPLRAAEIEAPGTPATPPAAPRWSPSAPSDPSANPECEARAQRWATLWLRLIAVALFVVVLSVILVVAYWIPLLDPLSDYLPFIGAALAFLIYALFGREIPGREDLEQGLLKWQRKRHGCPEPLPRSTRDEPTSEGLLLRDAERAFAAYRRGPEMSRRFAKPEQIVSQKGDAQVSRLTAREEAEIDVAFEHLEAAAVRARELGGMHQREPKPYTDILTAIDERGQLVLLGDPGAGKTTNLRKTELELWERWDNDPSQPVPLFIPLSEWTNAQEPLTAFIARQMGPLAPYLQTLLNDQRVALLLDGLDQVPRAHRESKDKEVATLFREHRRLLAVVSCRRHDWSDLDFDQLLVKPLDATRIRDVARRFLARRLPAEAGDAFFWEVAGGEPVRQLWDAWKREGGAWDDFWHGTQSVFRSHDHRTREWQQQVRSPSVLMALAANPFNLTILLRLYAEQGRAALPKSRARLFETFVELMLAEETQRAETRRERWPGDAALLDTLERLALTKRRAQLFETFVALMLAKQIERVMKRWEHLPGNAARDENLMRLAWTVQGLIGNAPTSLSATEAHRALGDADAWQLLIRLAWMILRRRRRDGNSARGNALIDALTRLSAAESRRALGGADRLRLARSAGILAPDDPVRFSHQLLQEYFVARTLRRRIAARWSWRRLAASHLWPHRAWWKPTDLDEAVILLAGLYTDDATPVVVWLADANPVLTARCINESGAHVPRETLRGLRELWTARLTGTRQDPDAESRAAVGRALALAGLDARRGVGLRPDGLPDIAWVRLEGGAFPIGGDEVAYSLPKRTVTLDAFSIAKYPVTNAQWAAFLNAPDGYEREEWWRGLAGRKRQFSPPRWTEGNRPREFVNWYEATAFCRWLTSKLGFEVRLPTEEEWERAVRGVDRRIYPWGNEWDTTKANTWDGGLEQTSSVGIYSQDATPEGVYDLAGNISEWTSTEWRGEFRDGNEIIFTAPRVVRGGSWASVPEGARADARNRIGAGLSAGTIGFRVVALAPAVL